MPSRLALRRAVAHVARPLRRAFSERAALRSARRFARRSQADVVVCWDLDNTLVDSGTLLRHGMPLAEAVVAAAPMASMLEFYAAVSQSIPDAEHVVLSARARPLRSATIEWLMRHGIEVGGDRVWLVPDARAKPAVWQCLGRRARLVIVDDLSHGHEGDARGLYDDLVETASRLAVVYVGLADIQAVADADAAGSLAERLASQFDGDSPPSIASRAPSGVA